MVRFEMKADLFIALHLEQLQINYSQVKAAQFVWLHEGSFETLMSYKLGLCKNRKLFSLRKVVRTVKTSNQMFTKQ
jgi:hypothetical protein